MQSYSEIEASLTQAYEKAVTTDALFDLLEALTPLARAAKNMHRALQSARESLGGDSFIIEMRDLADEADRNLDLLLEDVQHALQYRAAREAESQAQSSKEALKASHRLNILAALFFPLTAISSLFGMNLQHGLNERSPLIFWLVFVAGVSLGILIKSWVVGKPGPCRDEEVKPPESSGARRFAKQLVRRGLLVAIIAPLGTAPRSGTG